MPSNRFLSSLGLVLASIASVTSLPGSTRLPHHRLALHATLFSQLDDDEDREVLLPMAESEEKDEEDDPDPLEAAA
ncbi:hypothetical protein ACP4J4_07870 [Aureimonas ureilytica]|uniref:hypothetical protein n=1 Tax=Aureimonas ureilytica TaxID=401562 RepID=UPI003CEEED90